MITIVSRVQKGKLEILNQIRGSHPSFGKVGVIGGIVRKGESLEVAATRKLKVESGLTAQFKLLGIERRMMYKGDRCFLMLFSPSHTQTLIKVT